MWGYNFSEIEIEGKHVYVVLERERKDRGNFLYVLWPKKGEASETKIEC